MRPTAVTGLVFALCLWGPLPAGAEPADATVFIRLTGHVRVLSGGDRIRREVLLDLPQVEVGTGSGFIVSSEGWVLTNHHVVTGAKLDAVIDGVAVVIAIEVERIEVVLPREGGRPGSASHRYVASVYASDPDLDLAVLSISAPELPVVSLGDSDVVATGDAVTAIGYPFGSRLEIGKAQPSEAVPDVSVNAGSVSALRRNDAGDIRYLQTSAQLNPGNSGGPIVDADGYAVAVAQLAVERGAGVGFGVPINLVKAYLRRLGLDRTLPDDLLTLGPHFDEDAKGVQLRIPDGFQDSSGLRLRVEVGAYGNPVALRIDRLATPLPLDQMEKALLAGGTFEHFQAEGAARRATRRDESGRTVIAGYARGTDTAANRQAAMLYALIDLGREKIVARYVGTAAAIAMNRSVFRDSLAELRARLLLTAEAASAKPAWMSAAVPPAAADRFSTPLGWVVEAGMPSGCTGLSAPTQALSTSPMEDYRIAFRAARWAGPAIDAGQAAGRCAAVSMESAQGFSYTTRVAWWGTTYVARGVLRPAGNGGLWHLEMIAPEGADGRVMPLFDAWVKANAQP